MIPGKVFLDGFDIIREDYLSLVYCTSPNKKQMGQEFIPTCFTAVVILPFLGMEVQVGSQNADMRQAYVPLRSSDNIELLRLKKKYYEYSEELYLIYRKEYVKAFLSELNNVYVSLTRACRELYAFVPKKVGSRFNILKFMIPQGFFVRGEKIEYLVHEKQKADLLKISQFKYRNWIEYLKDEYAGLDQISVGGQGQRLEGEIIHYILSFVGNLSNENIDDSLKRAGDRVSFEFPAAKEIEQCMDIVKGLINDKSLRTFFYCADSVVSTEKEVVDNKGCVRRLDRLIVSDDEVLIVDYKSSDEENEKDSKQVREYIEIMKKMYPGRKVKGFLIYVNSMKVQEVET